MGVMRQRMQKANIDVRRIYYVPGPSVRCCILFISHKPSSSCILQIRKLRLGEVERLAQVLSTFSVRIFNMFFSDSYNVFHVSVS